MICILPTKFCLPLCEHQNICFSDTRHILSGTAHFVSAANFPATVCPRSLQAIYLVLKSGARLLGQPVCPRWLVNFYIMSRFINLLNMQYCMTHNIEMFQAGMRSSVISCRSVSSAIPRTRTRSASWFFQLDGCSFDYAHVWSKSGISIC